MEELKKRIADAVENKLNDGSIEKMVSAAVENAVEQSLSDLFRYNGGGKKIIDKKLNETMVPVIESFDFGKYCLKLDCVLTELVNSSVLVDNKKILENFRDLVKEPDVDSIKLSDIFSKYKKYVSENVDTDNLEINHDDSPTYQYVTATMETKNSWSGDWKEIIFKCEEDEALEKRVMLTKICGKWKILSKSCEDNNIDSLKYLSEFDIFILRLNKAYTEIVIDVANMYDGEVEVEAEPEGEWR